MKGVAAALSIFRNLPGVEAAYVCTQVDGHEPFAVSLGFSHDWVKNCPFIPLVDEFQEEDSFVLKVGSHTYIVEWRYGRQVYSLIIVRISQGDKVSKSIRRSIRWAFKHALKKGGRLLPKVYSGPHLL